MEKPSDYYNQARSELLPLLDPIEGASILDIGCGAGELGRLLLSKGAKEIYGIEIEQKPASHASEIYKSVIVGSAEKIDISQFKTTFDYVICADVLEHLRDPWGMLRKLHPFIKQDGSIVASIPNLRHRVVIGELLRGKFDYRDSGILDRTHLRFFTFDSIIRLFSTSGFKVIQLGPQYAQEASGMIPKWKQNGIQEKLAEIVRMLTGMEHQFTDDDLLDLFTLQFLLRAEKM